MWPDDSNTTRADAQVSEESGDVLLGHEAVDAAVY